MGTPFIHHEITFEKIQETKSERVYYGARTCWWTIFSGDLYVNMGGLPCDPRGGVLFETDAVAEFLATAKETSSHYGKHGLRTFMLAFHGCLRVRIDDKIIDLPTCFDKWEGYDNLIEAKVQADAKARIDEDARVLAEYEESKKAGKMGENC